MQKLWKTVWKCELLVSIIDNHDSKEVLINFYFILAQKCKTPLQGDAHRAGDDKVRNLF